VAHSPERAQLLSLWVVSRRSTAPVCDSQQKNKLNQLGREEEHVTQSISLAAHS
jgi:hypothetical protein